jgi:hypothetical protein
MTRLKVTKNASSIEHGRQGQDQVHLVNTSVRGTSGAGPATRCGASRAYRSSNSSVESASGLASGRPVQRFWVSSHCSRVISHLAHFSPSSKRWPPAFLSNGIVDFPVSSASVRSLHGNGGHYSIFASRISAGSQDAYRIFDLIELRFCFFKFTRRHKWQDFHCFGQPSL